MGRWRVSLGSGVARRLLTTLEHVALSRVGECLGACVSVCLGDAAGDEGTCGVRPGDGKGSEPPFVGATRVCGDRVVLSDVGHRLGVAQGISW